MDYYHFPDFEPEDEKDNIQNQNISGDIKDTNVVQSGRDAYINSSINNTNNTYIYVVSLSKYLKPLGISDGIEKSNFINYLLTLLLLIGVSLGWFLLRIFTRCKFPFPYITSIVKALFGIEDKNELRADEYNETETSDEDRFYYLHNQESQIWLLSNVISILSEGKKGSNLEILDAIEMLEDLRNEISQELSILKIRYYPTLANIQNKLDEILPRGNRELELLQRLIRRLIRKYTQISRKASSQEISSFINDVDEAIRKNEININPTHLKILNEIKNLAIWLLPIQEGNKSSDVRVLIPYKGSKKNKFHFNKSCEHFRESKERKMIYFSSWEEAKANGYEPCERCTKLDR
jgi:DNA-directed RNA polymerase beta subunit